MANLQMAFSPRGFGGYGYVKRWDLAEARVREAALLAGFETAREEMAAVE
jgi:hypothetical protein